VRRNTSNGSTEAPFTRPSNATGHWPWASWRPKTLPTLWEIPGASRNSYPSKLISKDNNGHRTRTIAFLSPERAYRQRGNQLPCSYERWGSIKLSEGSWTLWEFNRFLPQKPCQTGSCARLCHASGGELEQIQFLLGHVSVQTNERYLRCKQRIRSAVNDRIGIEPNPWAGCAVWKGCRPRGRWPGQSMHARCLEQSAYAAVSCPRTTFDRRLLSIRRSRFPRFFVVQLQNFLRAD